MDMEMSLPTSTALLAAVVKELGCDSARLISVLDVDRHDHACRPD